MRQLFVLILTSILINNSYSQKIDNDTLSFKKAIKSRWGIKIELGGLLHQKLNQDYFDNKIVRDAGLSLYYKQFCFTYEAYLLEFNPKKSMSFDNLTFNNDAEFASFNWNFALGYNFNFHKKWSSDYRIGVNTTYFEITNPEEINQVYKSDIIVGTNIGIGLNRYFKLKGFNYIVLSLGVNYYSTNYNLISSNLSRSSMNYSLTIGYKFWFSKKIDN